MMSNRRANLGRDRSQAYLQADEKFFWNLNVSMPFIERNFGDWTTPIANIWTETKTFTQNHRKFNLTLISRRGSRRQGPRYIKRGVDKNGDVANFVETEQILRSLDGVGSTSGELFAFTQIRGSIPLYWEQVETWRLKPLINPDLNLTSQYTPLRTHISAMCSDYCGYDGIDQDTSVAHDSTPDMVFVNLIDKKGMQGALGACLSKTLKGLQKNSKKNRNIDEKTLFNRNVTTVEVSRIHKSLIEHIWFDYHSKCAGGKTSSLGELMPLLDPISIGASGYLHMNRHGKILKMQKKIIRTNCIDCLDRTNVMQSNIARRVLQHQLSIISKEPFYRSNSNIPPSPSRSHKEDYAKYIPAFHDKSLEMLFREIWGDNGDNLSMLYAGTRALKRDVTRKGKRTRQGVFDDGVNSAKRYFINNFKDPRYQRALDIILGGDVDDTSSEKLGKLRQALRFKIVPGVVAHRKLPDDTPVKKEIQSITGKEILKTTDGIGMSNVTIKKNISNTTIGAKQLNATNIVAKDVNLKEIKHKSMVVGKKKRGETDDQLSSFKEQITDFYKKYNPSKIADIPNILQKYKGNEKQLLDNLRLKYVSMPSYNNNDEKGESPHGSIKRDQEEKHTEVNKGDLITSNAKTLKNTKSGHLNSDKKSFGEEKTHENVNTSGATTVSVEIKEAKGKQGKTRPVLTKSKFAVENKDKNAITSQSDGVDDKNHQLMEHREEDTLQESEASTFASDAVATQETDVLGAIDDLFDGLLHHWEEHV